MPLRGPGGRMKRVGSNTSVPSPGNQGSVSGFARTISSYPSPCSRAISRRVSSSLARTVLVAPITSMSGGGKTKLAAAAVPDINRAAGTASASGSSPSAGATAARIGISVAVVAVLLVNSVRNTISVTTASTTTQPGIAVSPAVLATRNSPTPLTRIAAARLSPPPNNTSKPQGRRTAVSQSIAKSGRRNDTGNTNNSNAPIIAIPASLRPAKGVAAPISSLLSNGRVSHIPAVSKKTTSVTRSPTFIGPSPE